MTDCIREQIVQAVITRLQPVTTLPVLRRETYEDEPEFVCVWDQGHETEKADYGRLTHRMDITIEYIHNETTGYTSPAQAVSAMYTQLVQTLFNDAGQYEPTLGGLAAAMTETGMTPFTPDAGMQVTGCALQIEVTFSTRNGDPLNN